MVLENLNRQQGSTAVRAPRPKPQPVKETVGAGAPTRAAAVSGGGRPPPARQGNRGRPQPSGPRKKTGARVVRESVTNSSGVKQIQRRAPRVRPSGKQRPNAKVSRGKRRPEETPSRESKSSVMLWVAILAGVLVAAGVGLYFSGLLDSFLGR